MNLLTHFFRIVVPGYDLIYQTSKHPNLIHKKSFQAEIIYRYIPLTFFFSWLLSLVPVFGDVLSPLIILAGGWHLYKNREIENKLETTLYYLVIVSWALFGIRAFVGHTLLAAPVAESIGWETGSPFQVELAFYHLGIALATFTLLWNKSKHLLMGIIIAKCTFQLGAMVVHLYDLIVYNNFNSGNIGPGIIYADLILPIIIIYLFWKIRNNPEVDTK